MKRNKRVVITTFIALLIILTVINTLFITSSLITKDKKIEDNILAYVDETTEVVTEEITTTEETTTTTTTEVITTTVPVVRTTERIVPGIAEAKGNVSQSLINTANIELNKLPSNIVNKFVSLGWHLYITDENIAQTYFDGEYSRVQGVAIYTERVILIEARTSAITGSLIHEMGHFVDSITSYSSYSDEFSRIYNEEVDTFKSRIVNSSCVSDKAEFFAETFYYVYKNPSKCTEQAYSYVLSKINMI